VREDLGEVSSDVFIADITMQAIIANALESLWENVLDHTADETKNGKVCILDVTGAMIPIPVLDVFSVVVLNAAHGDGRGDDIFCQIASQALAALRNLAFVNKGDKTFWIFGPSPFDVGVDTGIGNVFA